MEQDVDQIMTRIREEVRRQKGSSGLERTASRPLSVSEMAQSQVPTPSLQELVPEIRLAAPSAQDLLKLRDTDFVRNAYRAILKREADAPGLEAYVRGLRECTFTKADILQGLASSEEGRTKRADLPGLKSVILKNRIRHLLKDKIPVVRSVVRWAIPLLNLARVVRRIDSLEGTLEARLAEQTALVESAFSRHINDLNLALQAKTDALIALTDGLSGLNDKVSGLTNGLSGVSVEVARLNDGFSGLSAGLSGLGDGVKALERWAELRQAELQVLNEKSRRAEATQLDAESRFATLNRRIEDLQIESHGLAGHVGEFRNDFLSLNHIVQVELRQELETELTGLDQTIDALRKEFLSLNHLVVVGHKERLDSAEERHTRLERGLLDYRTSLLDQERRVAILLQEARKRMPAPLDQKQLASMVSEESHLLDAMYVAFEDRFRGTREDIKARVGVYVDRIQKAGLGTAKQPVFDVGCGRGEWLEVLRDHGLVARGIDLNRVMVSQCLERGLDVKEMDVIEALRALPTASVGVVSGFHIIEHVPLPVLISMLDEALRVLVPGGFILFETPNPENLITAACNFYYDPTHRNPLPPPLTQFLAEARGFIKVEIVRLHRSEYYQSLGTTDVKIAELLQAAQDFSVIGYKA